jgi:hypothetical protein
VSKPPAWKDEDAVADWAAESALDDWATKNIKIDWAAKNIKIKAQHSKHNGSGAGTRARYSAIIESAVTQAEHGRFRALAALLDPKHPWNKLSIGTTVRQALNDKEWLLISDRLAGKHKPKDGAPPKQTWERRLNPVHSAAVLFGWIELILGEAYPKQTRKEIRDRAYYTAARHCGIAENTLINYLTKRSKNDRRRLPLPYTRV